MDDGAALAARLNGDCRSGAVDRAALDVTLRAQGEEFFRHVTEQCPHLFACAPLFVAAGHIARMRAVIAAVESAVRLPGWPPLLQAIPPSLAVSNPLPGIEKGKARGVFMGYDFHVNAGGVHLIEINTNAGGAFLNALLLQSQCGVELPGTAVALDDLDRVFLDMFRNEWRMERGDAPLSTIAIVDEQPRAQYLYPEFLLAQQVFERAGIAAIIADPAELEELPGGLYCRGRKVDLVYNRLTDFMLERHLALRAACLDGKAVVTPHPRCYGVYADKRNLAALTDAVCLRGLGMAEESITVLQAGIPEVRPVREEDAEFWWQQRRLWFFKPAAGYGSRGAYRGDKLTRRVFEEIMRGGYVAQKLALPGERRVCAEGNEPASLKFDVRCYVYDGQLQAVAARLYQGQATNFRTRGGGFAQVRAVG